MCLCVRVRARPVYRRVKMRNKCFALIVRSSTLSSVRYYINTQTQTHMRKRKCKTQNSNNRSLICRIVVGCRRIAAAAAATAMYDERVHNRTRIERSVRNADKPNHSVNLSLTVLWLTHLAHITTNSGEHHAPQLFLSLFGACNIMGADSLSILFIIVRTFEIIYVCVSLDSLPKDPPSGTIYSHTISYASPIGYKYD